MSLGCLAVDDLAAQQRSPAHDFDTLVAAGNYGTYGIWSDGTTMWVADRVDDKLYAYAMATRARDPGKDFDTLSTSRNTWPQGVWSDGTTMWVADWSDEKLYAYTVATRTRDPRKDFDTLSAAGNRSPHGIWSDGTTMWVADGSDAKLYAYTVATKARDPSRDFDTLSAAGNREPQGIWSDSTTMWVADGDRKLYAYTMATKTRDRARDFDTLNAAGNWAPNGIWSDGTTMWVADGFDEKLYAYAMPPSDPGPTFGGATMSLLTYTVGVRISPRVLPSATGGRGRLTYTLDPMLPAGLTFTGTTRTLAGTPTANQAKTAYTLTATDADGDSATLTFSLTVVSVGDRGSQRTPVHDFDTLNAAGNRDPEGIWSDGTTMWVADGDGMLYAYTMATKARDPSRDFDILRAAGNPWPRGIWSDGTTMWVADLWFGKLNAYTMATKARDPSKDFDNLSAAGNDAPIGIWSDGTTMWVADRSDGKLYAYTMATKARDPGRDFVNLNAAGNTSPHGIWSDGTTMWVADPEDAKLYAYTVATRVRDSSRDFDSLTAERLSVTTRGIWSDGTTMWVAENRDATLYAYAMPGTGPAGPTFGSVVVPPLTYTVGVRISPRVLPPATGGRGPLTYTLTPTLPAGLSFAPATRRIAGTPTAVQAETMYTLKAIDARGDSTALTFRLTVVSAGGPGRQRTPAHDFDTLSAAGNQDARGIWSDGTTMWVADRQDDGLYAYTVATHARDVGRDFDTLSAAGNQDPQGIWSDGVTMWVADWSDAKLYAYSVATQARDSRKDFDFLSAAGNASPEGIWSDGTTMWIADLRNAKLYAYTMATGARDAGKDFNTLRTSGNDYPQGIWSDGVTMWVADREDARLYAYAVATRARVPGKDFDTLIAAGNELPTGIWSDGVTMWVADEFDAKLYAYAMPERDVGPTFGSAAVPALTYTAGVRMSPRVLPAATGGKGPLSYTLTPALPAGLTFTASTRTLAGTPVAARAETTYTLAAADGAGRVATLTFPLTVRPGGGPSSWAFTDPVLTAGETPIKAVHFTELREAVNSFRSECGLDRTAWTDPVLTPGVTPVKATHLTELRAGLAAAYRACGLPVPTFTDAVRTGMPIKVLHVTELRAAVNHTLGQRRTRQIASLTPPVSSVGPTEAGKRSRDRIIVTVGDASGAPVVDARWRIETGDKSGWVYPAHGRTDADGRISATWVAGSPGAGVLSLTAENAVSSLTMEIETESVASRRPPDGATAVWMHHNGRADGYSIDLTPLSEPTGTYYAAIQWDGGYTGLQRGGSRYDYQLQFSVWDSAEGGDAQVVERGDGVICRPFGGEGTGQACELNYPWRVGATYRFEVTEEDLDGGSAMTLHVTDLAAGRRRFVGKLRYAARANLRSFAMFVEDFVHRAPTCLAKDVRSAAIRRALARVGGSWQSITRGTVARYREDSKNPGTPACANRAARNHAAGLEMVIGGRTASDPDDPASVTIPRVANTSPVAIGTVADRVLPVYGAPSWTLTGAFGKIEAGQDGGRRRERVAVQR